MRDKLTAPSSHVRRRRAWATRCCARQAWGLLTRRARRQGGRERMASSAERSPARARWARGSGVRPDEDDGLYPGCSCTARAKERTRASAPPKRRSRGLRLPSTQLVCCGNSSVHTSNRCCRALPVNESRQGEQLMKLDSVAVALRGCSAASGRQPRSAKPGYGPSTLRRSTAIPTRAASQVRNLVDVTTTR